MWSLEILFLNYWSDSTLQKYLQDIIQGKNFRAVREIKLTKFLGSGLCFQEGNGRHDIVGPQSPEREPSLPCFGNSYYKTSWVQGIWSEFQLCSLQARWPESIYLRPLLSFLCCKTGLIITILEIDTDQVKFQMKIMISGTLAFSQNIRQGEPHQALTHRKVRGQRVWWSGYSSLCHQCIC